ncbi:hypothetical protein CASFOL_027307 [Castilleja foliolosa]|uniref:Transcription initiation factor TFIID subunit 2 TPR repeats domain-containing protein n=1 Tax=Castilleja foliolosa TaxID=1961234 RepID=A0ABD3CFZ8_9LAMI
MKKCWKIWVMCKLGGDLGLLIGKILIGLAYAIRSTSIKVGDLIQTLGFRVYNDNSGNKYSDVLWAAALIQSVGELEFGPQSISHLPSLLKQLDRLLQFDRLMPSHNGILKVSCIQSLTQMALKISEFIPHDRAIELIKPYLMSTTFQIRVAASRALLELEFQCKGTDAALTLFTRYLNNETSLRESPTLYGVPRDESLRMGHAKTFSELKNISAALVNQSKTPDPPFPHNQLVPENYPEINTYPVNRDSANAGPNSPPVPSLIPGTQQLLLDAPDIIPEKTSSVLFLPKKFKIMTPQLQMPPETQQPAEQLTNS